MKVQFTPNTDNAEQYKDLTPGNIYRVIGLEADYIRFMSDEGQPYIYPLSMFTIVDAHWPSDWIAHYGEDGECYASPEALSQPGFFEDYFDGDKQARVTLRKRLASWRRGED